MPQIKPSDETRYTKSEMEYSKVITAGSAKKKKNKKSHEQSKFYDHDLFGFQVNSKSLPSGNLFIGLKITDESMHLQFN